MKNLYLLTLAVLFAFNSSAQHDFGLSLNGALSKTIETENYILNTLHKIEYQSLYNPSYNFGIYYNLHISKHLLFGSDILFTEIEGNEIIDITYIENPGYSYNTYRKHLSYLSLPVYFGLKFEKTSFYIGFMPSLLLKSKELWKRTVVHNEIVSHDRADRYLSCYDADYGPKIGLRYNIKDNLIIEASYYYGLKRINEYENRTWKNQQISLGFRYTLFTTKKPE